MWTRYEQEAFIRGAINLPAHSFYQTLPSLLPILSQYVSSGDPSPSQGPRALMRSAAVGGGGSAHCSPQVPLGRVPLPVVFRSGPALRRLVPRRARSGRSTRAGAEQGGRPHGWDQRVDQAVRRRRESDGEIVIPLPFRAAGDRDPPTWLLARASTHDSCWRRNVGPACECREPAASAPRRPRLWASTRKLHRVVFSPAGASVPLRCSGARQRCTSPQPDLGSAMRLRSEAVLVLACASRLARAYTSPPVTTSIEASWPAPDLVTQYLCVPDTWPKAGAECFASGLTSSASQ